MIEEYLSNIPADRIDRFESILDLNKNYYPETKLTIRYKMPTLENGVGWISVANQKNYISVYTCRPENIEGFKKLHPKIKTGKGCINFRDKDEIPLEDLKLVVFRAMEDEDK